LKLSVTAIEDWLRDPYTIYAKHILAAGPLDPVDMPLSAADRGSAIHDALGEFTQTFATALPDQPALVLRGKAKYFAPLMERPEARALWWPRFQRIAKWFADWNWRAATTLRGLPAEIGGRDQDSARQRTHFHTLRTRRPGSSSAMTAALRSSITNRPAADRKPSHGPSPQ